MSRTISLSILSLTVVTLALVPPSAWADDSPPLPAAARVEGVVGYPQERNLSCESRSAADLGAYWGAEFTEAAFLRRLPRSDNPHRGFLGDVDMPPGSLPPIGYGVYAEPIGATLRSFGLAAEAHRPFELNALKRELAAGRPVIVWATYEMQMPGVDTWVSWDGETTTIVRWQHTFIAVAYDEQGVSLIDAYDAQTRTFSYDAFLPAWDQLGRMAVTVSGPLTRPSTRPWRMTSHRGHPQFVVDGRGLASHAWRVGPQ